MLYVIYNEMSSYLELSDSLFNYTPYMLYITVLNYCTAISWLVLITKLMHNSFIL
jgi:hypothetical protein